jgi:hypothetical protein
MALRMHDALDVGGPCFSSGRLSRQPSLDLDSWDAWGANDGRKRHSASLDRVHLRAMSVERMAINLASCRAGLVSKTACSMTAVML